MHINQQSRLPTVDNEKQLYTKFNLKHILEVNILIKSTAF